MAKFDLEKVQDILKKMNFDAWLFYDFRGSNSLAHEILNISPEAHLTRRFFYLIPKSGTPVKIVNGIEAFHLDHLPGKKLTYSSHDSLDRHLRDTLSGLKTVAMEYSPMNAIPYVSKVDAGTLEYLRTFNIDVKSSGDLISMFGALWTPEQFEENKTAASALYEIVRLAFRFINEKTASGSALNEYDVQQFIMDEFKKRNMITDSDAIVAVNENSANPHYAPDEKVHKDIKEGDFVLIDLWARMNTPESVMADITWVGYMGSKVPEKYTKIFNIVAQARDEAFSLVKNRFKEGREIRGFEVDDAARKVIQDAGYGDFFIHRTGHSITTETHGSGAHMDNFETRDERLVLPSTSFSIEPGIYLTGDFGVRSEIDVFISPFKEVIATGEERQKEIVPILK
ncbi:MAG: M24 family metallopeptidase [Ignavibacteria bacterium]|jgi:Xaa-Pro aminopeptidase|nr:M24 family metallopeptidase [Ignavibacteria bacterium]MCU7503599.1 M24 family metallopeptidase [Ignavibacteria bacterium]MCU7516747.1 M24 family metallopeptidase [Ignavibacteria bacterium]